MSHQASSKRSAARLTCVTSRPACYRSQVEFGLQNCKTIRRCDAGVLSFHQILQLVTPPAKKRAWPTGAAIDDADADAVAVADAHCLSSAFFSVVKLSSVALTNCLYL